MRHSIPATMCNLATLCMLVMTPDVFAADRPQKNAVDAQFNAMDVNGDGKLSPEEHAAGAKRMFDTMDANKDGTVTADEMDAAHEKITGQLPIGLTPKDTTSRRARVRECLPPHYPWGIRSQSDRQ